MQEKEQMQTLFEQLTDENKQVLNMIANGMKIAQENTENKNK